MQSAVEQVHQYIQRKSNPPSQGQTDGPRYPMDIAGLALDTRGLGEKHFKQITQATLALTQLFPFRPFSVIKNNWDQNSKLALADRVLTTECTSLGLYTGRGLPDNGKDHKFIVAQSTATCFTAMTASLHARIFPLHINADHIAQRLLDREGSFFSYDHSAFLQTLSFSSIISKILTIQNLSEPQRLVLPYGSKGVLLGWAFPVAPDATVTVGRKDNGVFDFRSAFTKTRLPNGTTEVTHFHDDGHPKIVLQASTFVGLTEMSDDQRAIFHAFRHITETPSLLSGLEYACDEYTGAAAGNMLREKTPTQKIKDRGHVVLAVYQACKSVLESPAYRREADRPLSKKEKKKALIVSAL